MQGHPTFTEGSAKPIPVAFYDQDGQLAAPISISYRIECLTDGSVIRSDTVIAAAAQVTILIDGNDNRMVTQRARETHRLIVSIVDAEGSDSDFFDFDLRRA